MSLVECWSLWPKFNHSSKFNKISHTDKYDPDNSNQHHACQSVICIFVVSAEFRKLLTRQTIEVGQPLRRHRLAFKTTGMTNCHFAILLLWWRIANVGSLATPLPENRSTTTGHGHQISPSKQLTRPDPICGCQTTTRSYRMVQDSEFCNVRSVIGKFHISPLSC